MNWCRVILVIYSSKHFLFVEIEFKVKCKRICKFPLKLQLLCSFICNLITRRAENVMKIIFSICSNEVQSIKFLAEFWSHVWQTFTSAVFNKTVFDAEGTSKTEFWVKENCENKINKKLNRIRRKEFKILSYAWNCCFLFR